MTEYTEPPALPPAPDDLTNFWGSQETQQRTEEDVIDVAEDLQGVHLQRQPSAASSDADSGSGGGGDQFHGAMLFAGQEEVRCTPSLCKMRGIYAVSLSRQTPC